MAMIGIKVPREVGRQLSFLDVPGEKTLLEDMHITLIHLGDALEISEVTHAIEATYEVVSNWTSFLVGSQLVSSFDAKEGTTPVIARVKSAELHVLHAALCKNLDSAGVEYSKKFPDFKPHITLSYCPESETPSDFRIDPIVFVVNELTLWGGDAGEESLSTTFPFGTLKKSKFATYVKAAKILNL